MSESDDDLKNLTASLHCMSAVARLKGDRRVSACMARAADAISRLKVEIEDVLANSDRRDLNRRIMMQRRHIRTLTAELNAKNAIIHSLRAKEASHD